VNQVVADAELDATVGKLAETIAGNAPLSVRGMKFVIGQALRDPGERDLDGVGRIVASCFDSADYREGRTAFMEKRRPVFTGR
jgi:enoyl-CoA hydratase